MSLLQTDSTCFLSAALFKKLRRHHRTWVISPPKCFWPKCHPKALPAVACKSSRERKQQIKTAPFMMAARRTLIATQAIYTQAGRLKGTQGGEAGRTEGQLVEGLGWRCSKSHCMPQGLYVYQQLTLIFRGGRKLGVHRSIAAWHCVSAESLNLENGN